MHQFLVPPVSETIAYHTPRLGLWLRFRILFPFSRFYRANFPDVACEVTPVTSWYFRLLEIPLQVKLRGEARKTNIRRLGWIKNIGMGLEHSLEVNCSAFSLSDLAREPSLLLKGWGEIGAVCPKGAVL